ncbi:MAG: hypothetical protein ACYDB7_12755, partial [Mycobacteriales bacterium]
AGPELRTQLSASAAVPVAGVSRPLAEGLAEVLVARSRVGGVSIVPARVAAGWGVAEGELLDRARRQVLDDGLLARRTVDLGGVRVTLLEDVSNFTATHVLWLPTYVDVSDYGALVALPTRTVVLAHALVDSSALAAVQALLVNAARLHASGPQSLSPQLYWWRPGPSLTALPAQVGQERVNFFPPGDFVDLLDRLPPHGL